MAEVFEEIVENASVEPVECGKFRGIGFSIYNVRFDFFNANNALQTYLPFVDFIDTEGRGEIRELGNFPSHIEARQKVVDFVTEVQAELEGTKKPPSD